MTSAGGSSDGGGGVGGGGVVSGTTTGAAAAAATGLGVEVVGKELVVGGGEGKRPTGGTCAGEEED